MALRWVLRQDTALAEIQNIPDVITTLTTVFCDATLEARGIAAVALRMLAVAQPTKCEGMVESGMVELLLKYYCDAAGMPALMDYAVDLACGMLRTVPVAAREFEQAIRAPEPVQAFAALVLVEVCPSSCILLVRCTITPPCIAPFQGLDQEVHVKSGIAAACLALQDLVSLPCACTVLSALTQQDLDLAHTCTIC
jgi:hypothetical protein